MPYKKRDLTGQKFGHLTVIRPAGQGKDKHYLSLVRCDCGNEYTVRDSELLRKNARQCCKDCCKPQLKHGQKGSRLYTIWQGMKKRCYTPSNNNYKRYGAKGVMVCDEWKEFIGFYNWAINNGYEDNLTIDRIDYTGDYEPNNCRWADRSTQANNTSTNHYIWYKGEKYTMKQLSDKYNIKYHVLAYRVYAGWDLERAITQPVRGC